MLTRSPRRQERAHRRLKNRRATSRPIAGRSVHRGGEIGQRTSHDGTGLRPVPGGVRRPAEYLQMAFDLAGLGEGQLGGEVLHHHDALVEDSEAVRRILRKCLLERDDAEAQGRHGGQGDEAVESPDHHLRRAQSCPRCRFGQDDGALPGVRRLAKLFNRTLSHWVGG